MLAVFDRLFCPFQLLGLGFSARPLWLAIASHFVAAPPGVEQFELV